MEDLDYRDLFRDAIHTIAYIARAAGFDPNDPTVEPPDIIARIENQRADLERLTTERAALLAPVGGVDLEEVLRRAEEIRSMHGRKRTSNESARLIGLTSANATAAPALARALMAERAERAGHEARANTYDAELHAVVRVLEAADHVRAGKNPAAAVAEVVAERDGAQYEAEVARDSATMLLQERDAAHEAGSNLVAENERLQDALRAARNEAEELRLTLAAAEVKP